MVSNKCVPICNRFHTRKANMVKIRLRRGTLLWRFRSRGTSAPQGHEILSRKIRDLEAAHSEDFVILACTERLLLDSDQRSVVSFHAHSTFIYVGIGLWNRFRATQTAYWSVSSWIQNCSVGVSALEANSTGWPSWRIAACWRRSNTVRVRLTERPSSSRRLHRELRCPSGTRCRVSRDLAAALYILMKNLNNYCMCVWCCRTTANEMSYILS